ncbi:MAG: hypothetical protein Q9211_001422 [Gyalolechia sp. 1 TL-2023]
MASNILSRFLPPDTGSPSIYETLRQQDESSDQSDVEQRAAMAVDEENLGREFHDYELGDVIVDAAASQSNLFTDPKPSAPQTMSNAISLEHQTTQISSNLPDTMDEDDEVPQSLLIEDHESPISPLREQQPRPISSPVPGPATKAARAKWHATQEYQRLHTETPRRRGKSSQSGRPFLGLAVASPRERAMWRWANVEDLDNFLRDVYEYFLGNGIWSILLSRFLNLL